MRNRLRRWSGVRAQATIAAAMIVAAGMVLGSVALLLVLQNSLTSTLQDTVSALVSEDARTLADGGMAALEASETDRGHDPMLVQVIDSSGRVVYTSTPSQSEPMSAMRPAAGQTQVSGGGPLPPFADDRSLTVAQGVRTGTGEYVVLASSPMGAQAEAVTTTAVLLAIGVPLLTMLAAAVTWWRVGGALGSVDAIRVQVERIGATNLVDRVPVPDSADEIAQLASTMNDMLARLESADQTQRQFVADASHELRSPLATLAASVEVAATDPSGTSWTQMSPILSLEIHRMTRLVNDLLLLSRLDEPGPVRRAREVDLDDLADREAARLRQVTTVTVTTRLQPTRVVGDEHHLTQVLRNLLENAAVAAASQVRLTVGSADGVARVVVDDDGPGIPAQERERIFDRFVRLDQSRARASGGSGLGLAITAGIVAAHGGTVTVDTSPMGGARMTVTLPLQTPLQPGAAVPHPDRAATPYQPAATP